MSSIVSAMCAPSPKAKQRKAARLFVTESASQQRWYLTLVRTLHVDSFPSFSCKAIQRASRAIGDGANSIAMPLNVSLLVEHHRLDWPMTNHTENRTPLLRHRSYGRNGSIPGTADRQDALGPSSNAIYLAVIGAYCP
jgi:hypothetical protein